MKTVIFGDSLLTGLNWHLLRCWTDNQAISGIEISDIADKIQKYDYRWVTRVIFDGGLNDLWHGKDIEDILSAYYRAFAAIPGSISAIALGILPVNRAMVSTRVANGIQIVNYRIKWMCPRNIKYLAVKMPSYHLVDGHHLTRDGLKFLAEQIRNDNS